MSARAYIQVSIPNVAFCEECLVSWSRDRSLESLCTGCREALAIAAEFYTCAVDHAQHCIRCRKRRHFDPHDRKCMQPVRREALDRVRSPRALQ